MPVGKVDTFCILLTKIIIVVVDVFHDECKRTERRYTVDEVVSRYL